MTSPAFSVSSESSFQSTPMFFLIRSITSPAVTAAAPDTFVVGYERRGGSCGSEGGEFAPGQVSHVMDES